MHSTLFSPFVINERIIFDYEIIFVESGGCLLHFGEKTYTCKKDDIIFIRPGIPHKFENLSNTNFIQPHIHFDICYNKNSEKTPISFKNKRQMSVYELSLIQKDLFCDMNIPYIFNSNNLSYFKSLFYNIIDIFQNKKINYQLLYKSEMLKLLNLILVQFCDNKKDVMDIDPSIVYIKNYIDSNYKQIITLDSLTEQFYINKYTMLRKFKKTYDKSIIRYYNDKRLNASKDMLLNTKLKIKDIAIELNFDNIYSFSRAFKNGFGISPIEYRRLHSN